jgi:hypothetical protein
MMHGGMMEMHVTFYTGKEVTLWTEALTSSTWAEYLGLVMLVTLFGFAHEGLYAFRAACLKAPAQRRTGCGLAPNATASWLQRAVQSGAQAGRCRHRCAQLID